MALNKIFAETQNLNRERPVPAGTLPGVPLLIGTRPAVTLTAEPSATASESLSDGTTVTYNIGGVGNKPLHATVAFDGTFEFAVEGATTDTISEVAVYITGAGALTLTEGSNTLYGHTDYPAEFRKEAGRAPVRVGTV